VEDAKRGEGRVFISNPTLDLRLSASDNKSTVISTKNRDAWEIFKLIDCGGGKVLLQTWHGTYLSQNDGGVLGQSPNTAGWEQFFPKVVGGVNTDAGVASQLPALAAF